MKELDAFFLVVWNIVCEKLHEIYKMMIEVEQHTYMNPMKWWVENIERDFF